MARLRQAGRQAGRHRHQAVRQADAGEAVVQPGPRPAPNPAARQPAAPETGHHSAAQGSELRLHIGKRPPSPATSTGDEGRREGRKRGAPASYEVHSNLRMAPTSSGTGVYTRSRPTCTTQQRRRQSSGAFSGGGSMKKRAATAPGCSAQQFQQSPAECCCRRVEAAAVCCRLLRLYGWLLHLPAPRSAG